MIERRISVDGGQNQRGRGQLRAGRLVVREPAQRELLTVGAQTRIAAHVAHQLEQQRPEDAHVVRFGLLLGEPERVRPPAERIAHERLIAGELFVGDELVIAEEGRALDQRGHHLPLLVVRQRTDQSQYARLVGRSCAGRRLQVVEVDHPKGARARRRRGRCGSIPMPRRWASPRQGRRPDRAGRISRSRACRRAPCRCARRPGSARAARGAASLPAAGSATATARAGPCPNRRPASRSPAAGRPDRGSWRTPAPRRAPLRRRCRRGNRPPWRCRRREC